MIEFDAEIQLPAVLSKAEGQGYARRDQPWSIVIRWDGADGVGTIGSDVLPLPDRSSFSVDATLLRSNGFGPVNELALASWGLRRATASSPHRVLFSVSTSFLLETAKLRAFRVLQSDAELWAIGDVKDLSVEDVASNGIRTTLQTVAAVWGTADHVCILPNNAPLNGFSDPESARLAANIGRMLREESYANQIPDPTAGSLLLDTAVGRLVDAVEKRVQDFDATGASSLQALLILPSVERLRARDQAWWASRTNRPQS
ncbi:MAG: methylmalonyl-CoA mutase family protein [Rhodothermales bacterium]